MNVIVFVNGSDLTFGEVQVRTKFVPVLCHPCVAQVPNLAGLARTCEIFAASSLVVPDTRLVKHPSFSKISTGAEQWLPIEEVGEKRLLAWLRRAKRQRYALVGIEQTNNSVCLTKVRLLSPFQLFTFQCPNIAPSHSKVRPLLMNFSRLSAR